MQPGRAIRSGAAPSRIAAEDDVGDHRHPNVTGENRIAAAVAEAIARLRLPAAGMTGADAELSRRASAG